MKKPKLNLGGSTPAALEEKKEAVAKSPSRYDPTSVKLFATCLDDIHMNKYKSGWYTLLKFTEQVKKDQKFMDELRINVKENKIEKPDNWMAKVMD